MGKFFKKIGRGIKKFSKSKLGKVVGIAAGVGLTAVGVGAGVKALKAAKAMKGIGSAASKVKKGKGILGVFKRKDANDTMVKGGVSRLAKRLARKADRKQRRLDRKQARLMLKQTGLDQSVAAAREALGGGEISSKVREAGESELNKGIEKFKENFLNEDDGGDSSNDATATNASNDRLVVDQPMSTGAKVALGVGAAGVAYGAAKALGLIK